MRSIVYGVLVSLIIIGGVEYGYQVTGGLPSVVPGQTPLELQWKIKQARSDKAIYFAGDSRVDWGIANRLIKKLFRKNYGMTVHTVNAGLSGGSVSKITKFILDNHPHQTPGVLVINYSPASFYHFDTSPGQVMRNLKRQDFFDHRIANYLVEWLFTYGRTPVYLFKHFRHYAKEGYTKRFGWLSRTLFPEGFVNAVGGFNDGSPRIPDLSYYHIVFDMIRKNPEHYAMRKNALKDAIREAEVSGWQVILVRLPIGDKMLKLEYTLPEFLHPEKIAAEMFVPFIDYEADPKTADLPSDESHLKPDSAREMASVLTQDIGRFMIPDSNPGISIRRATVHDAPDIWRVHAVSIKALYGTHYNADTIQTWLQSLRIEQYKQAIQTKEMFVAETSGTITGFGQLNLDSKEVESIAVAPHISEHLIRSALLNVLEQVAWYNNVSTLKLSSSQNSVEFYTQAGYAYKEVFQHHLPNGTPLAFVSMIKVLSETSRTLKGYNGQIALVN